VGLRTWPSAEDCRALVEHLGFDRAWVHGKGRRPRGATRRPRWRRSPSTRRAWSCTAAPDAYILPACFEGLDEYMPNLTLRRLEGVSHWLCDEHPELVNRSIREYLER
jgi:pimeloyl-ACP methyl ester carboxylesterase